MIRSESTDSIELFRLRLLSSSWFTFVFVESLMSADAEAEAEDDDDDEDDWLPIRETTLLAMCLLSLSTRCG